MLSDPVAEAFGLIHRHPSGENFWRGQIGASNSGSKWWKTWLTTMLKNAEDKTFLWMKMKRKTNYLVTIMKKLPRQTWISPIATR